MKQCRDCKHFLSDGSKPPCVSCHDMRGIIDHRNFKPATGQIDASDKVSYWHNITAIQHKQTEKGQLTYGKRLEDDTELTPIERIEMIEEEMIDALMYLEHLKASL